MLYIKEKRNKNNWTGHSVKYTKKKEKWNNHMKSKGKLFIKNRS